MSLDVIGIVVDQRYQVLRLLGQGGMGAVYEAEHTGTGRRVALKVIGGSHVTNVEVLARFQREARAVGSIDTQHIVQIFDTGEDPVSHNPYIAMELLSGEDLEHLLARRGRIESGLALRIVGQACIGLQRAHAANVVHRDIKPANLFLSLREESQVIVKLLDFGVAKVRAEARNVGNVTLTGPGGLVGSPTYMSPEQARGLPVDHRTDIWSLGVVLYEALTGRPPHQYESLGQILTAISTVDARSVSELVRDVPKSVAAVVHRALDRDPEKRFQSAAEMLAAIRAIVGDAMLIDTASLGVRPSLRPMVSKPVASGDSSIGATSQRELAATVQAPSGSRSNPSAPSDLPTGDFDKYHLIALLGQGGMADVFLAVVRGQIALGFKKFVVIKRLRRTLTEDAESLAMLLDEARLAARLSHPNLVQTNEVGHIGKEYYMAMEYLDGQPLHRLLARARERLPRPLHYRILTDVLAGLEYAHDLTEYDGTPMQVVHRDVTPHNVFVTYDGHVKVVDFGIAKALGRMTETRTGVAKGKMTYMAPEQALALAVDRRVDIFSVGVMLWEAATGTRYWNRLQEVQIMQRLLGEKLPPSPRVINPDTPQAIDRICARALAYLPEHRYQTATEFRNDLEAFLGGARTVDQHRDLGRVVAELFADERAELQNIIESQLATLRQGGHASIAAVGPVYRDMGGPTPSRDPRVAAGLPAPAGQALSAGGSTPATMTPALPPPRRRGRRGITMGIVATGLVAAAAVYITIGRPSTRVEASPESSTPPRASQSADAKDAPSGEAMVLTMRAVPPKATFSIDGGPATANPYVGRLPKDGRDHTVLIQADGYVPITRVLRFDGDADLSLTLEPVAPASTASARVTESGTGPAPHRDRPKRPIDEENPWRH